MTPKRRISIAAMRRVEDRFAEQRMSCKEIAMEFGLTESQVTWTLKHTDRWRQAKRLAEAGNEFAVRFWAWWSTPGKSAITRRLRTRGVALR